MWLTFRFHLWKPCGKEVSSDFDVEMCHLLHIEHMGCRINARMEDRVFKHNLGDITIWVVFWYVYLKPKKKR